MLKVELKSFETVSDGNLKKDVDVFGTPGLEVLQQLAETLKSAETTNLDKLTFSF